MRISSQGYPKNLYKIMTQDTQSIWTVAASVTGTIFLALYGKFKGKKKPELTDRQKFEDSLRDTVTELYDQISKVQHRQNETQKAHEDCESEKIELKKSHANAVAELRKVHDADIDALKQKHEQDMTVLKAEMSKLKRRMTVIKNQIKKGQDETKLRD
jgi:chromosome segregation ATPase